MFQISTLHWLQRVVGLLFPSLCAACKCVVDGQQLLCIECAASLQEVDYNKNKQHELKNRLTEFIDIEEAITLFYYLTPSPLQSLMWAFKYEGYTRIGEWLGSLLAQKIIKETSLPSKVDTLIPVPLHPKRFKERGYNQSVIICKGIAKRMDRITVDTHSLIRIKDTQKQALQASKEDRIRNTNNVFTLASSKELEYKHLLLIDDVCTTGSTLAQCASELYKIKGCKISVATTAIAI